jgi:hypothetical protein
MIYIKIYLFNLRCFEINFKVIKKKGKKITFGDFFQFENIRCKRYFFESNFQRKEKIHQFDIDLEEIKNNNVCLRYHNYISDFGFGS